MDTAMVKLLHGPSFLCLSMKSQYVKSTSNVFFLSGLFSSMNPTTLVYKVAKDS